VIAAGTNRAAATVNDSCDVVIVGAGPVGATAALLLASYGLDCVVLEPRREPQTHPAAHVISTRSMEIWREVGLERDIRRLSSRQYEMRCIAYCTTLNGPELGRVPLAEMGDAQLDAIESISPTRNANLPQSALEPLLWQRLRATPGVDLRCGWRYLSHTEGPTGVQVTLGDDTTAAPCTVSGRYLIAADGANSAVRRAMRVTMNGPVLQHVISVHFSADLEKFRRDRRGPVMWTYSGKGFGVLIIHRPPHDLVFHIPYFPPLDSPDDFGAAVCRDHILDAIGDATVEVDIRSIQPWTMHAQVANSYRIGRAFLAGDAAHRFPPTGGLGLNTGIADVHNLAWKLAWVLGGLATEELLDTYEQERHPVGRSAADDSLANIEGLFDVIGALGLPRRAARLLPGAVAALARLPRRPARALMRRSTALAYRRFELASAPGAAGQRRRRRAAAVIGRQGKHFRSWGRDLGVVYQRGAVVVDGLPQTHCDPEFYVPSARAGGRVPHRWTEHRGRRQSTLDLIHRDRLTALVAAREEAGWARAARGLPIAVVAVDDTERDGLGAEVDGHGLVARPDGHIAALLRSDRHPAVQLGEALRAVSAPSHSVDGADA
jgi:2-polyprenyl-6-methoxyphenol hydroxylase-like FAD-dependent oxidoreductase